MRIEIILPKPRKVRRKLSKLTSFRKQSKISSKAVDTTRYETFVLSLITKQLQFIYDYTFDAFYCCILKW